jgi:hypothetical protein
MRGSSCQTQACAPPASTIPLQSRAPVKRAYLAEPVSCACRTASAAADDPITLSLLREAQQQADALRRRLADSEAAAARLLHNNIALKQQLGLPTEEEQAALAAWLGGASSTAAAAPPEPGREAPASAAAPEETAAVPTSAVGEATAAQPLPVDEHPEGAGEGAANAGEQGEAADALEHASDEADSDGFVAVTAAGSPSRNAAGSSKAARRRRGSAAREGT